MAHLHPPTLRPDKLRIGSVGARLGIPGLLVGLLALLLAAWLGLKNPELKIHLLHSYLAAFSFFLMITLGSLLFVLIHYATRAGWSVTVRRLAEALSLNFFLLILLLAPIIAGAHELLEWLNPGVIEHDEILTAKSGYLNPAFLFIRLAACFFIWALVAWFFASRSARQDATGDPAITTRLETLSYAMIIVVGFTLTIFVIDWIMGLNPHWFSTIFGVYMFAGAMLCAFSAITLLALILQKRGLIGSVINHDHYHDLGKWMFAFTFFWGYIGFSQYMLIWYANLPEETQFFIPRQIGFWAVLSFLLLFVHFLIPFPGLLSRHVKRKNTVIAFWAVWSLLACAFDIYWLVIPSQWIQKIPEEVGHPHMPLPNALAHLVTRQNIYQLAPAHEAFAREINFPLEANSVLITALCFVGIGGLYLFSTMIALRGKSLVPTRDPRLDESLAFENV